MLGDSRRGVEELEGVEVGDGEVGWETGSDGILVTFWCCFLASFRFLLSLTDLGLDSLGGVFGSFLVNGPLGSCIMAVQGVRGEWCFGLPF